MTLRHYKYSLFFVAPNVYYRVLLQVKKKASSGGSCGKNTGVLRVCQEAETLDGLLTGFDGALDGLILLLPVCLSS